MLGALLLLLSTSIQTLISYATSPSEILSLLPAASGNFAINIYLALFFGRVIRDAATANKAFCH
jgi:hypothetical protein